MKKYSIDEEVDRLTRFVREKGGDAVKISADQIVTGEWVRMKCLFGCNGFGRRFSCPPYTPTPAETRAALDCYSCALLVRFEGDVGETTPERLVSREMTRYVQTVMFELEEMAKGAVITDCKNRRKMRPSMEAAGIDVYATCANVGWNLDVLECTAVEGGSVLDSPMSTVMLLLIE